MYVSEKNLEADKLMVGAVTGFFKVMAAAEKTNPAKARDIMEDLEKIDPAWAQKVQECGADAEAKVRRFISSQSDGNA